jgi:hypothetical protein
MDERGGVCFWYVQQAMCEVHPNTGTLQVETRRKEGMLAGDSGRENNEGKGKLGKWQSMNMK